MVRRALLLVLALSGLSFADTGFPSNISIKTTDNATQCSAGQIKVSPGSLTCTGNIATVTTGGGGYALEPATVTIQANLGITASTATFGSITDTTLGSNPWVTINSSGTSQALTITDNGYPSGGVQNELGVVNIKRLLGSSPGASLVLVDSVTDSQLGAGVLEIWSDNPLHNDPLFWIHRTSSNSSPEMRWDSPSPNFEMVNTSTDNALGYGKWEPFASASQSVDLQVNNRSYSNGTFETLGFWHPLSKLDKMPGLYINAQNVTDDGGVLTSSDTSGIHFGTLNSHTVGLTGPQSPQNTYILGLPILPKAAGLLLYNNGNRGGNFSVRQTTWTDTDFTYATTTGVKISTLTVAGQLTGAGFTDTSSMTVTGQGGITVTFGVNTATLTVTGSSVSVNGVASSYPAAACLQNQVLVSDGGTAPQSWSCQGQSGSGGGVVGYSGSGVSLASTIYFPIVGGLAPSATESAVDSPSPSGATLANFYAQLSQAVGVGNSVTFTWRKNGTNQSLTCAISGANADSCNDTSHSFTVSQGDTVTIQAVPAGTIIVTPNVVMVTQFGTTGSNGTVNNGTANQLAYYAAGGTAVSGTSNLTSVGNSIIVNSSISFNQGVYFGTNTVTSNYTCTSTDTVVFCDASGGARTITLSTASYTGQELEIFKVDTSANSCVVVSSNTNLIVSTGTLTLNAQGSKLFLIADGGSKWWIKSYDATPAYAWSNNAVSVGSVATSSNIYCNWNTTTVPLRVTGIRFLVGTANGNMDVALIDTNGNRLGSAGVTAVPTSYNTMALTSAVNLLPGQYGVCMQVSNVTATIWGDSDVTDSFFNTATTMGIPATVTLPGTLNSRRFSMMPIFTGGQAQ